MIERFDGRLPAAGAVVALSKERNDTLFQKTMKGEEPKLTLLAPHSSLDDVAHHAVDVGLTTESIGAVNPALTAMANAIRVGEHLVDRLR